MSSLWYAGICDRVLARVESWRDNYHTGEISATRPYLHPKTLKPTDLVTKRALWVPWRIDEMQHLVSILEAMVPGSGILADFHEIQKRLPNCRARAGGYYLIMLNFYEQDVRELCDLLLEAKTGQTHDLKRAAEKAKAEGKGPFEL